MENEEQPEEAHTPEQAAAMPGEVKQGPEQDETDSEAADTGEHSDAPGPFGTG